MNGTATASKEDPELAPIPVLVVTAVTGLGGDPEPFCDGAHAGTGFTPEKVVLEEKKRVALCCCKRTANAPFCDGTHSRL